KFLKEIIEILKEEAGNKMAVAIRFSPNEDNQYNPNETLDFFNEVSEMPDLWDLTPSNWDIELGSSRFSEEGDNIKFVDHIKKITSKPVVAVGRFTSVDAMVSLIKKNIIDIIGAARPSIADPFLPKKIQEDRLEDIRECIGCNICYTGDQLGAPIRCTQNPTMGEEWRRGWHPEILPPKKTNDTILVVGSGPSGLEAAHALGKRNYRVLVAEEKNNIGGRVVLESTLSNLNEWIRVKDYRQQQFLKLPNVEIFLNSKMYVKDILDSEVEHIVFATGSNWRSDGFGRSNTQPIKQLEQNTNVYNPDDIMNGKYPSGEVAVFDDDYYYLGPIIAEILQKKGCDVTYITTSSVVCEFGNYTSEQYNYQRSLIKSGVKLIFSKNIISYKENELKLSCIYSEKISNLNSASLVMVTSRVPNDKLYYEFIDKHKDIEKIKSIKRIGDCLAPATIASAVYDGRKYAMEFDDEFSETYLYRRDSNLNI
ncbi:FAD-dependent oxidoreductase, partial [Pelagibacterales bacterium SAG-MED31]|nr:FAD-dependent oxidoreductase [Pelagibacterales bacterium SAG-MED31]